MSKTIRQLHRWLSIAFTLGVVTYMVAVSGGKAPPAWMGLPAPVPLILLLISGLYMFFLPYAARWRGARSAG